MTKYNYLKERHNGANMVQTFLKQFGTFLSNKIKVRRTIMLKENENYLTEIKDLCKFVNLFSTNAISIRFQDEIDITKSDLTVTISKHTNHENVKTIRAHHEDGLAFDFKAPTYMKDMYTYVYDINIRSTRHSDDKPKMLKAWEGLKCQCSNCNVFN